MRHAVGIAVGPARFRIGSAWRASVAALRDLYRDYPPAAGIPDATVRLEPAPPWRRWLRPSVVIAGDYRLPEAAPLPLGHALLAAEMGMNLQIALGWRRHLLLHAAVVERDGRALVLTGASGSGKSTLAAMLAPFPRPISLKNDSIALLERDGATRWGPRLAGTPKGDIRHLIPDAAAIARMQEEAAPALMVFPSFGFAAATRPMPPSEAFVRLTQASTNYVALGEVGFAALTRLVRTVPAVALDYPDSAAGLAGIDALWGTAA